MHKPDERLTAGYYNFAPGPLNCKCATINFFSRFACQTCGSMLAGDRYYATATDGPAHTDRREQFEICADCYEWFFT